MARLEQAHVQRSKCKVKFNAELSAERQEDTLSPTLVYISTLLKSVLRESLDDGVTGLSIGRMTNNITLAAYEDDKIIIGETEESVRQKNRTTNK